VPRFKQKVTVCYTFCYFRYLQEQGKGCPAYRPVEMPVEVRLFFRKVRKV